MLVDANLLLYAVDESSPFHDRSRTWLTEQLDGPHRIGLPWQSLVAFVRISTNPRAYATPLTPDAAWSRVVDWLDQAGVWTPVPGPGHFTIMGRLISEHQLRANLVSDAHLAALAIEHGLSLCSADTDFARFTGLTWLNPLA